MDQLLDSRLNRGESSLRLQNISPDKFGKGAYANLSYTPSKLANNVIYKEVSHMKKIQQGSSKIREAQSMNSFLKEKLRHLQQEKEGIEKTLTLQIIMYKKMNIQMENSHQERIKAIQGLFSQQMQRMIEAKEEEAKYIQSQKQLLENRIYQLEGIIAELKQELNHQVINNESLARQCQRSKDDVEKIKGKCEGLQKKIQEEGIKYQKQIQNLNRTIHNTDIQNKSNIEKILLQNAKEKENLAKQYKNQFERLQSKQNKQINLKNEQLKNLKNVFEQQINKMKDIVSSKDKNIEHLNNCLKQEKDKLHQITKRFTSQIATLNNQKNKYMQELKKSCQQLERSKQDVKKLSTSSTQTSANYEAQIEKLKKQLEGNILNFNRQKDRFAKQTDEMKKQIAILRKNVQKSGYIMEENSIMSKEIRHLKELLMESSMEMQRCKIQFVRLDKQKEILIVKLKQLDLQNETLYKLKMQMQDEARGWRQTYYMSRR